MVVAMQPVKQFRPYGPHVHPPEDRQLRSLPARGTESEEPGIEDLVLRVDAKSAVCLEALSRAYAATTDNERQSRGHHRPLSERGSTSVFVRTRQTDRGRLDGNTTCAHLPTE